VKEGGRLKLFMNGKGVAASDEFDAKDFDLTNGVAAAVFSVVLPRLGLIIGFSLVFRSSFRRTPQGWVDWNVLHKKTQLEFRWSNPSIRPAGLGRHRSCQEIAASCEALNFHHRQERHTKTLLDSDSIAGKHSYLQPLQPGSMRGDGAARG
jgi:hypothetical protein